jgi:hypothetical protein
MSVPIPPDESALLAEMKRAWAEQFQFFSNKGKEKREHWIAHQFLALLGLSFSDAELRSHPQASKVDVEFREALFQVKEITDPNFRRGDETKATYRRVMAAQTLQDTVGPGFVYDIPPPVSGYELVRDAAVELGESARYRSQKAHLDLLFYVTRTPTSPISSNDLGRRQLAATGWRSVSCLIGQQAVALHAAADAPKFLRAAVSSQTVAWRDE